MNDDSWKTRSIDKLDREERTKRITRTLIEIAGSTREMDDVVKERLGIISLSALIGDCHAIIKKKIALIHEVFPEIEIGGRTIGEGQDEESILRDDYNALLATILNRNLGRW